MALPHLPPERIEEYSEKFHILEGFLGSTEVSQGHECS